MPTPLEASYRACEKLARSRDENFTVSSFLMSRPMRRHLWALYAFARTTDDLGDESPGDRIAHLNAWQRELEREESDHPILPAVKDTLRSFQMPLEPFLKLIEANRMDQTKTRFPTWPELEWYCDHSANPCGRMVLYLFGVRHDEAFQMSDATCTALQLTNFWQDIAIDFAKGRVYIPQEELTRAGVSEEDLSRGIVNTPFRALLRSLIDRTRRHFRKGLPLANRLSGAAKFDVRLFSFGGLRILDLIEEADYDVFRRRPSITKFGKAWLMFKSFLGARPRAR